jgi:hypothetical protein
MSERNDMGKQGDDKAGESGHGGPDRQPGKEHAQKPESEQTAATPPEVKSRSTKAAAAGGSEHASHGQPDALHPGPNRDERERSKGDLHHDQHEKEKEMKFNDL